MVDIAVKDLGNTVLNRERVISDEKHSGFFLTISTNFKGRNEEDEVRCANVLRKALKKMFTDDGLSRVIKFLPPHENDTWGPDIIKKVDAEFVVEKGRHKKGGRIHSHALVHITHKSKLQFDFPSIKGFVLDIFDDEWEGHPIKNIYVNAKMVRSDRGIKDYLRKELGFEVDGHR